MADDEQEETRDGANPVAETLARNIRRIREGRRVTFVELKDRLTLAGRPIPVLGLRRIERGERRVDADDLLALAYVLHVSPVDLLVPADQQDDEPYAVTSEIVVTAGQVREWIAGGFLFEPESVADLPDLINGMPKERAQKLLSEWAQIFTLRGEASIAEREPRTEE